MHRAIVLAAAIALATGTTANAQQRNSDDSFNWSATMSSGSTLQISNINGPVTVVRATGNRAEVIAVKRWNTGDPSRVRIEAVRYGAGNGSAAVCAMWSPTATCSERGARDTGRNDNDNNQNDVSVSFTVRLPAGVEAVLTTVNGAVEVRGATASVVATTVNGNVTIEGGSGNVTATTVNGSVDAELGSASGNGDLTFTTVNGSVTVGAPSGLNANVTATTVMGGIESDFPMTVRGRVGNRSASGTLGSGGRSLTMTTVMGSITLRRN